MNLEDLVISALFASMTTIVIMAGIAYRVPLGRFFRNLGQAIRQLVEEAPQPRLWHLFGLIYAMILVMTFLNRAMYRDGLFFLAVVVGLSIGFTILWAREFLFLMALRDDDFPGRFDKLTWSILLLAVPPLGLYLFRSHRLSHWPEPEPKPRVSPAARELA